MLSLTDIQRLFAERSLGLQGGIFGAEQAATPPLVHFLARAAHCRLAPQNAASA